MRISFIVPFLLFSSFLSAQPPVKLALLVGVGQYPEDSGWRSLGADNDLELLRGALLKQGFLEENILILQNQNATKAGITTAFRQHLIEKQW